jgi:transposase, IS30 family
LGGSPGRCAPERIARTLGRENSAIREYVGRTGGTPPRPRVVSELRLSQSEREEISRGLAAGWSLREIAWDLGRAPSTVSREVNANGGRRGYRAIKAERAARRRARRPKVCKIAASRRLRAKVEAKLADKWSPEEISGWLARTYPNNRELQVSHETIYQSLFVQGRGALRHELHVCLRSGRAMRRNKKWTKGGHGMGKNKDMVMISERPVEVEDRAVPGHWEGDLILGKGFTSVGTLVERTTRYVILLRLPPRIDMPCSTSASLPCPSSPDRRSGIFVRSCHRTIGPWQSTLSEATTRARCLIVPPLATAESALTSSPISAVY